MHDLIRRMIDITYLVLDMNIPIEMYLDVSSDDDPITPLFNSYIENRMKKTSAVFYVYDGYIYLITDNGFTITESYVQDYPNGYLCDSSRIYTFAPIYRDLPSNEEDTYLMLKPNIPDKSTFISLLRDAFESSDWIQYIPVLIDSMEIAYDQLDQMNNVLKRIIGKHHLLILSNEILDKYPCTIP